MRFFFTFIAVGIVSGGTGLGFAESADMTHPFWFAFGCFWAGLALFGPLASALTTESIARKK